MFTATHSRNWALSLWASLLLGIGLLVSCEFDPPYRWVALPKTDADPKQPIQCTPDTWACIEERLQRCSPEDGGHAWQTIEDCGARGEQCELSGRRCVVCAPGSRRCNEDGVPEVCAEDGSGFTQLEACDESAGFVCRAGGCRDLCQEARSQRSNVGCEYWAADLDNANLDPVLNAAEQQFAVVVSNPHSDVSVRVQVYIDDTLPGEANDPVLLVEQHIGPMNLRVFPLGPREVDGSIPGVRGSATHSALSRAAFRITSSVPVVAYQFNPLDNVNVFSNDASLLKPVEALNSPSKQLRRAYVVLGWPQTIAITDDPNTSFGGEDGQALRAFLTLVGTRPDTRVRVIPTARIVGAPGIPETKPGEVLEMTLQPFDVLNLETDDFNADFTGTLVESDGPVVAFSGSEASDAPHFEDLSQRACCADHLEEQLDPIATAGKLFVAPVAFNRSLAVASAGGDLGTVAMPEVFRVIAATEAGARVRTTLEGQDAKFELEGLADFREITTSRDFLLESDEPVMLSNVSPSQQAAGVPNNFPGGDPSFLIIPPVEQYRSDYVFLTPQFYAFDFLRIMAPPSARIALDGEDVRRSPDCTADDQAGLRQTMPKSARERFVVWRCQLSFPIIDPNASSPEGFLRDGDQNDGVHRVVSSEPVGVLVDGFDRNVSYAYAAGTELVHIVPIPR